MQKKSVIRYSYPPVKSVICYSYAPYKSKVPASFAISPGGFTVAMNGAATVSGIVKGIGKVQGAGIGSSTASWRLGAIVYVTGAAAGSSSATLSFNGTRYVTGVITAGANVSGNVKGIGKLTSDVQGTATATINVAGIGKVTGTISAGATVAGGVKGMTAITGSTYGVAVAEAEGNAGASNPQPFITAVSGIGSFNGFTGNAGCQFTIPSAVSIHALGRWVQNSNTQTHTVSIFGLDGTLLISAVVVTAGKPVGEFSYTPITPYALPAGTYNIVSSEIGGGDVFSGDNVELQISIGSVNQSVYGYGGSLSGNSGGAKSYGPVNFTYQ